jgi:transcriptional regulator with XRE-family HTH domain/drug/metabolite transporter (DMT)-like permease
MSFRNNLQYLRTQRNMTQEQLAMLLGVSRQSISKWESEKSYPEMDKLLMVCDIFGCTLDDLVMGDVRYPVHQDMANLHRPIQDKKSVVTRQSFSQAQSIAQSSGNSDKDYGRTSPDDVHEPNIGRQTARRTPIAVGFSSSSSYTNDDHTQYEKSGDSDDEPSTTSSQASVQYQMIHAQRSNITQDVTDYDRHMRSFAWKIALGVAAIITGVAFANLFDDEHSILGVTAANDFAAFLCVALGVVAGLILIVPAAMAHGEFKRQHPYIEDFYTDADRSKATHLLAWGIVSGIAVILVGIALNEYSDVVLGHSNGWSSFLFLITVAIGVACFILSGMRRSMVDIAEYNGKNEEAHTAEKEQDDSYWGDINGAVSGIIMLIATIIGLWWLFAGSPVRVPFWIPWPIGGVLCGISSSIVSIFRMRAERTK